MFPMLVHGLRSALPRQLRCMNAALFHCSTVCNAEDVVSVQKAKISKAMKAYLERAKEHESCMETARLEYKLGKRHLANMMGADVENFTQQDIDQAVQYLFPSGLYDPAARPTMKPPEEFIPKTKGAEFDETGRPFHTLFYTGRPNFFQLLFDIVENINKINALEDATRLKGKSLDSVGKALDTTGSEWLPKELLEKKIVETISDIEYENFVSAMNRLVSHPLSERVKGFLIEYRKPLISKLENDTVPTPLHDTDGRQYVTIYECLRKTARADVTVKFPGSGKIEVNGQDLRSVGNIQQREQVLFPLLFTNMSGRVDISANVSGGGPSSQAGAVRWGIAMALRSFVDAEQIARMRVAGLLTRDYRRRERKKPGQAGARRKYTWKKR
ncbi:28S ribosomal protein S9, mitochondrial [Anopheles moucheti]|uniref:28S ribosomal protein S9, mitochondrial n=1 Tax=Anopheles moucheti TaxID=186751 RepID=UPI0022F11081|nr:28S ribosomal protein S9, mitochondrial [Anopheles moucheti]XP_052892434.1 28S ribosomal protein S9, mitochondrial [Anopheles moucheti]